MCTKSNPLNRVVFTKTIDKLYYEPRNAKRCHSQAFQQVIHPILGICEATKENYLNKATDEVLKTNPLPEHFEYMLELCIDLIKNMPPQEAAKVLRKFCDRTEKVVKRAKKEHKPLNAAIFLNYFDEGERNPDGKE